MLPGTQDVLIEGVTTPVGVASRRAQGEQSDAECYSAASTKPMKKPSGDDEQNAEDGLLLPGHRQHRNEANQKSREGDGKKWEEPLEYGRRTIKLQDLLI